MRGVRRRAPDDVVAAPPAAHAPPGAAAARSARTARITATHPVATPDPSVLKWVVPDGLLAFCGPVASAPAPLQALLEDGTLEGIHADAGAVLTALSPGRTWRTEGGRVRSALLAALSRPELWEPTPTAQHMGSDEVLQAAAQEIATGPVGTLAHNHGGAFVVRKVHHGVVEVGLEGACHDCPAAVITMHVRFERLLRRRCPWLVEVRREA